MQTIRARTCKPDIIVAVGLLGYRLSANLPPGSCIIPRQFMAKINCGPSQMMIRRILTVMLLLPLSAFAQSAQTDLSTLRARDAHQNLLIAADPYVSADRYTAMFGQKPPSDYALAATDVFFPNT